MWLPGVNNPCFNGESSIKEIIDGLVKKFEGAPREVIAKDVVAMLQPLAEKGFIILWLKQK